MMLWRRWWGSDSSDVVEEMVGEVMLWRRWWGSDFMEEVVGK